MMTHVEQLTKIAKWNLNVKVRISFIDYSDAYVTFKATIWFAPQEGDNLING